MNYPFLLDAAKIAARAAGEEIELIYNSNNFDVKIKKDHSPITLADTNAHNAIINNLKVFKIPIISEEGLGIPFDERKNWTTFWMIDPLDGTKEFIQKNGDFCVNIALIENNIPVLGVIYAPISREMWFGGTAVNYVFKSDRMDNNLIIQKRNPTIKKEILRVATSRDYGFIKRLTKRYIGESYIVTKKGSALKFMLLVDGLADIYPRTSPCMEWDTAAAHAILLTLDRDVKILLPNGNLGKSLYYNKENFENPYFIAQ